MDEILASIRRIIADDQDRAVAPPDRRLARSPGEPSRVREPEPEPEAADADGTGDATLPLSRDHAAAEVSAVSAVAEPPPSRPALPEQPSPLALDEGAQASIARAFDRLAAAAPTAVPVTLEEHVLAMLRPMLKAWLDEHLPPLVERLVEAEIERIARGR